MALQKYVNIGGVWKPVTAEFVNIGGVWKNVATNYVNVGGDWKAVPVGNRFFFTGETVNQELYQGNAQGTSEWYYDCSPDAPYAVACNDSGESYWCVGTDLIKLNSDGSLGWIHTSWSITKLSVATEKRGGYTYIYVGDYEGNVECLRDGVTPTTVWATNVDPVNTPPVNALAVDSANGFVFVACGFYPSAMGMWRCDVATGTFGTRRFATTTSASAIAVDSGSPASVYLGDATKYYKLSADGYKYWEKTRAGVITQLVVGHDGYGYFSCETEKKIAKFTLSTGVTVWEYTPGLASYAVGVGVDQTGSSVFGVFRNDGGTSGNYIYKVNGSGVYQWRWQSYVNVKFYGMAVTPGIKSAGY